LWRRHQGQIGITNNMDWREPRSRDPRDVAAAERALQFQLGTSSAERAVFYYCKRLLVSVLP
jgi:hypothetical protein